MPRILRVAQWAFTGIGILVVLLFLISRIFLLKGTNGYRETTMGYDTGVGGGTGSMKIANPSIAPSFFGQSVDRDYYAANEESAALLMGTPLPPSDAAQRMVIKTGELSLKVKSVEDTQTAIEELAKGVNGYIAGSSSRIIEEAAGSVMVSITVRVPSETFETFLKEVKAKATKVVSQNLGGQDVTDEYVDLSSRMKNLQATQEQLYLVMKKAEKIPDILEVQRELTRVNEEIEVIKGRMGYLEKSTDMATLIIYLSTEEKDLPILEKGWDPLRTAKTALRELVGFLQSIADVAIWIVIFIGPLAIAIAVLLVGVKRFHKK